VSRVAGGDGDAAAGVLYLWRSLRWRSAGRTRCTTGARTRAAPRARGKESPEWIAQSIHFLAARMEPFLTGKIIEVAGGRITCA